MFLGACSERNADTGSGQSTAATMSETTQIDTDNPFFEPSSLSYEFPPFDGIENEHYLPAFEAGMAEQLAEIDAIVAQDEPPGFDNTLVARPRQVCLNRENRQRRVQSASR
jgi:hypothetical protein